MSPGPDAAPPIGAWRSAARDDLGLAGLWAFAVACAVAIAPLLHLFAPLLPPCPLHALTGIPCPTCGATRAAMALARGDLAAALALNPLAAIVILAGLAGGATAPIWVALHGPIPRWRATPFARLALAAVLAVNWAYLLARGGHTS